MSACVLYVDSYLSIWKKIYRTIKENKYGQKKCQIFAETKVDESSVRV